MDIWAIFWIFLILSMLQPVAQKQVMRAMRQRKIAAIERSRGSRVILLVHRQETMSLLGFPLIRYIDLHDSEAVIRAIHMTDPSVPIDMVLHTPGGLALPSFQIARALRDHPGKVTVFVPHYAMSGGTLIALAADEIVMCRHSALGPMDPQLNMKPAASILTVLEKKPIKEIDDETLILADVGEKAIRQVRLAAKDLLSKSSPGADADRIATVLTSGTWTHDYPIGAQEAKEIGLNISLDMPEEVLELMALYPQPVRGQRSVEYIPGPRPKVPQLPPEPGSPP